MVYKVAIIGAGIISKSHLKAINEIEKLQAVAIADIQENKLQELTSELVKPYTNYKEMVETERPDIVVITLPHFLHKEAAVWCANQGCHVMLEKPMALNCLECDEIIKAMKENNVQLLVGHTQHYMAENLKAKAIIESEELGHLVMINDTRHLNYYSPKRPAWFFEKEKAGGGIMMNLGSHSIDKIQWLTGSEVTSVKASLSYYGQKGNVEGSGLVFLETSKKVTATISMSGYAGVPKNQTEFIFTNGMLKLLSGQGLWVTKGGEYQEIKITETIKPFRLKYYDLLRGIEQNRELNSSNSYAKSIISVLETIYRSHECGRELPVRE